MTLEARYYKLLTLRHDITEHLGLLRGLAMDCKHVVEFGFRSGESTTALLMGGAYVTSYDIRRCQAPMSLAQTRRFTFRHESSLEVTIPECDMLFIDSYHSGRQLASELDRHHGRVKRWIAMHDTETFGQRGQGRGEPGLQSAIDAFLDEHPEWRVLLVLRHNNGLTVLQRDDP